MRTMSVYRNPTRWETEAKENDVDVLKTIAKTSFETIDQTHFFLRQFMLKIIYH